MPRRGRASRAARKRCETNKLFGRNDPNRKADLYELPPPPPLQPLPPLGQGPVSEVLSAYVPDAVLESSCTSDSDGGDGLIGGGDGLGSGHPGGHVLRRRKRKGKRRAGRGASTRRRWQWVLCGHSSAMLSNSGKTKKGKRGRGCRGGQ